jgi:hypothetical protein
MTLTKFLVPVVILLAIILTLQWTGAVEELADKPVIHHFNADPVVITKGSSSTLNWDVSGATIVVLEMAAEPSSGSRVVTPVATTVYVLSATNKAGSVFATVQVTVNPEAQTGAKQTSKLSFDAITYTNNEYGFTIKYPSNWEKHPEFWPADIFKVTGPDGWPVLAVSIWGTGNPTTLGSYVDESVGGWEQGGATNVEVFSTKQTTLLDGTTLAYEVIIDVIYRGISQRSLQLAVPKSNRWISIEAIELREQYSASESLLREMVYSIQFN